MAKGPWRLSLPLEQQQCAVGVSRGSGAGPGKQIPAGNGELGTQEEPGGGMEELPQVGTVPLEMWHSHLSSPQQLLRSPQNALSS